MENFYFAIDNERFGPINKDELIEKIKKGEIKSDTLIWCKSLGDNWLKAVEIAFLANFFEIPPPLPGFTPPPLPLSEKIKPQNQDIDFNKIFNKYWKPVLISTIFIGLILLVSWCAKFQNEKTYPDDLPTNNYESSDPNSLDEQERTRIINESLSFTFPNSDWNTDGDIVINVTNRSDKYSFDISQIGMRTKNLLGNESYHNPRIDIIIDPGEQLSITVPFPKGTKPLKGKRPYPLLDATKISLYNE